MRLERLRIGGVGSHPSARFKNLKNAQVEFDSSHWVTVGIGPNGSGKSNILEALAIIFRELITDRPPQVDFAFELTYRIGASADERRVSIHHDPLVSSQRFQIRVTSMGEIDGLGGGLASTDETVSLADFRNDDRNLPKHVFSYYSGESTRLQDVFRPYMEKYDATLRSGKDPGFKRLFYALPSHSQFVLLAFLIHDDPRVWTFLADHLQLDLQDGVESVMFVLRQPPWTAAENGGDPRFWNARGVVQQFLNRLQNEALAPIQRTELVPVSLWNKKRLEFRYLFLPGIEALRRLVGTDSPADFFRDLESTYVSQLIDEVRIRVRVKGSSDSVTFRELSEGEQQLLTVLGLLRFTAKEESLFLLDEPDTHLNPKWGVNYLRYLELFLSLGEGVDQSCQVVMTTHNPISIASLEREQVLVVSRSISGETLVEHPAISPKGMGFAGVVTSEMFGLKSSLDQPTSEALARLHYLASQTERTADQTAELQRLRDMLDGLDFNFASRDRLEQEFRRARFDLSDDIGAALVSPESRKQALSALVGSLLESSETLSDTHGDATHRP